MNAKNKAMDVPDIGGLLGKITDKRDKGELGTTERQHVIPVKTEKQENEKLFTQKNVETEKSENKKTDKPSNDKTLKRVVMVRTATGGRPTLKNREVEYVRLGAKIPKEVKQLMESALTYEWFVADDGTPLKTADELLALILYGLLKIPEGVRQQMKDALNYERFKTGGGKPIKSVDELLTLALERLLTK
jgi:hypothetical protein